VSGAGDTRAAIVGIAGPSLLSEEIALFRELPPAGVILFGRNCSTRKQLSGLVVALRTALGDPDLPVLIDQEGGRVMRLKPPEWRSLPPMRSIGDLAQTNREAGVQAARLVAHLIASDLAEVGITIDCAPVLDLGLAETTTAIGSRAFGADAALVADLGEVFVEALEAAGIASVIKHLPGHGRARVDSHVALPRVEAGLDLLRAADLEPFRRLASARLAMTAHVVYTALDPERPATLSPRVISDIVRGEIGFSGVLMSDDLDMAALAGPPRDRALRALEAGCDIALFCPGRLEDTRRVLEAMPRLPAATRAGLRNAQRPRPEAPLDPVGDAAALDALLAAA
jgi:beta-N-acetylhexosaminidase